MWKVSDSLDSQYLILSGYKIFKRDRGEMELISEDKVVGLLNYHFSAIIISLHSDSVNISSITVRRFLHQGCWVTNQKMSPYNESHRNFCSFCRHYWAFKVEPYSYMVKVGVASDSKLLEWFHNPRDTSSPR